jgi:hypothetical protein
LNILYAGRLGRLKRHIKYSIFSNYNSQGNVSLKGYNDSIFDPDSYQNIQSTDMDYRSFNNYEAESGTSDLPVIRNLGQEDFMIGGTIEISRFRFGYLSMQRKTHSALGLNSGAVSYADSSTFYGEDIQRISGFYEVKKTSFSAITNLSLLKYGMNNESSKRKIVTTDDLLSYELATYFDEQIGGASNLQGEFEEVLSARGKSYTYGGSDDVLFEQLVSFDLKLSKTDSIKHDAQLTSGTNL